MPDEQWKELSPECVWALTELSERQLPPEAARRLESHLAVCPSCRQARQWDRQLAGLLGGDALPPVPRRVERRLGTLLARRKAVWWSGTAATLAVTATLLLGTAVVWWTGGWPTAATPEPQAVVVTPDDHARGLDDLAILMAQPPVPVLERAQSTWLAVLVEACEGDL
jgi:anti-sigma factor RsiW